MKVRIYFETAATGSKTLMEKINLSTQRFWKRNFFIENNILELILEKLYIYQVISLLLNDFKKLLVHPINYQECFYGLLNNGKFSQ